VQRVAFGLPSRIGGRKRRARGQSLASPGNDRHALRPNAQRLNFWLDPAVVNRLRAMQWPARDYSAFLIRLAKGEDGEDARWPRHSAATR
jgi:hypothetical protein